MKKYSTIFLVFFSIIVFGSSVYAHDRKILVVYTEWFPYTYEDNCNASGFEIDIIRAVMDRLDVDVEFKKYPWQRCLLSLKGGEADALVSMLHSGEREEYTWYAEDYISLSKVVLFKKKGHKIRYTGRLEELKPYSVGVIMGFTYGEAFDNAAFINKDNAVDSTILINKILHGRNDVGAENQIVATATSFRMGVYKDIQFLEPPLFTKKLYVGFSKAKGHKQLSHEFSQALSAFKKTIAYKKILGEYGLTSEFLSEQ